MNPNPAQVASIQGFVGAMAGGWTNSTAQIRAAMAADLVANPIAQPTVPTPFTMGQLLGVLSSGSLANLKTFSDLGGLRADVNANSLAACAEWCAYLPLAGVISSAEATAILAIVQATQLDPSWTAQVTWDVATLGRPVDGFDIEIARHSS